MDRKKLLKQQYKETPRPMGVYQIKNNRNGKVFIDSSMNLPGMINRRQFELKNASSRNADLSADWQEFGPEAFSFEVLETINPEKILPDDWRDAVDALYQKWVQQVQPFGDRGYNKEEKD